MKLRDDLNILLEPRKNVTPELAEFIRANKPAVVAALLERDRPIPDAHGFGYGELAAWDHIAGEWVSWSEWMWRAAKRTAKEAEQRIRHAAAAAERARREQEELERASAPRQGSFAA